mgnify:CR=1 FL=1
MSIPTGHERYLSALTLRQIREIPEKDGALVIVPTGAIEQHGPHLPVGVDSMLSQAWLGYALSRLEADDPVWVAPPITYGKSNEHVGFPGTVTIERAALRKLLRVILSQLLDWGFRNIALLNTHGGNTPVLKTSIREFELEHPECRLGFLSFEGVDFGLSEQEATYGFHAGEWETSLLLELAPDCCDPEEASCEYPARVDDPGKLRPESAPAIYAWVTADLSESGIMGDATAGSAEKGRRFFESGAEGLVQSMRKWLRGL